MIRLVAASVAVLLLAPACGGASSTSAPAAGSGSQATEAAVDFKGRVELKEVLEMCRRHDVRPTQLVTRFPLAGETITSGVMVEPGMSEAAITKEFRRGTLEMAADMEEGLSRVQRANIEEVNRRLRSEPLYVQQLFAAGSADALRSLQQEASVRSVFLKP